MASAVYPIKKHQSLTVQLSVAILIITTTVLAVFGYLRQLQNSERLGRQLDSFLSLTADRIALELSSPLYNYYDDGVWSILTSEMNNEALIGVFVVNSKEEHPQYGYIRTNHTLVKTGKLTIPPEALTASREIQYEGEVLGDVHVLVTTDILNQQLRREMVSDAFQMILLDFVLVFTTLLFLRMKFIRPIKGLKNVSMEIAAGKLDQTIDTHGHDEIGVLAKTFADMRNSIKEKIASLNGEIQERIRAEQALMQFRSAVEASSDAIGMSTAEGEHWYQNRAFEELFGEIGTDPPASVYVDETLGRDVFQTVMSGRSWIGEVEMIDATGNIVTVLLRAYPVKDNAGCISGLVGVHTDITERKRVEAALMKSERNYREIFNASSDAIFIHDPETGRILDVNETMLRMYGYEKEEALTLEIEDISSGEPPYIQAVAEEKIQQAMKQTQQVFEWQSRKKNGEVFWVEVFLRYFKVGDDARVLAVVRDITERRRSQEAIKKERDRAQQYLDIAGVMFVAIDKNQRLQMINKKGCDLLGYAEHEIIGKNWFDHFIKKEDRDEIKAVFGGILTGNAHLEEYNENTVLTKSGEERIVAWHSSTIRDENGVVSGVLSSGEDITERRRVEEHLQKAQKMEAIGTLAGGIAHDFNNILSAIMGYTELSLSKVDPGTLVHGNLLKVLKAGERARDLVQQILTFSRKSDRELLPVRIKPMVKEAIKFIRATLPASIEIRSDLKDDPVVMADPTQIHQIIMNLCTNAGHAMQTSGGVLEIGLELVNLGLEFTRRHPEMRSGSHVKLTVSDTGRGMSPDVMARIFDPFFTTKEKGEGTGMGLAVVHGIVNSQRGSISVYSEPGKGAVFTVFLPATETPAIENKAPEKPMSRGKERILFLDDEDVLVDIGKDILGVLGYQVTGMQSSLEALELIREDPDRFDLVITDLAMPKMTGDRFASHCLAINPDLPIILCTGFSATIDERRAKEIGIRAFVNKPILQQQLAETVRSVLDEKP